MKTKHAKFSEKTNISYPLIRACTCAYQWGKKCSFVKRFGVLCFLETPILRFALLPYYRCYPVFMASQIEEDVKVHKVDNSWHYKHLTANFFWKFELFKFPLTLIKRSKNGKLFFCVQLSLSVIFENKEWNYRFCIVCVDGTLSILWCLL